MIKRLQLTALALLTSCALLTPVAMQAQPDTRPSASPKPFEPCCNVVAAVNAQGLISIRDKRTGKVSVVKLAAPRSAAALALHVGTTIARFEPVDSFRSVAGERSAELKIGSSVAMETLDPPDGGKGSKTGQLTGVLVKIAER